MRLHQTTKFCTMKGTINKMKGHLLNEISANDVSDKGVNTKNIQWTYTTQHQKKKKNPPNFKNGRGSEHFSK